MELILDLLRRLPDYPRLRTALESAQAVGVSGAAQINRSHLIAALCRDTARPAVVVCQDEMAARRTQSELAAFLGAEAPILPTRDLMFYDASAISRGWEQQRLRCLYDLARGKTPLLLTTLEAFSLRTMPRAQLFSAAMRLLPGAQLELDELISRLLHAGYSRCSPRGGRGPVQRARRHCGHLLPGRGAPGASGILRRRDRHHGLFRPRHAAARRKCR